jgi:hypothetical protein
MRTFDEVIKNKIEGLYYGNRVLLPFICDVFKCMIENDIITDFSLSTKGAHYTKHENFTEIYFHDYNNLDEVVSKFETVKLVVVENGKDIFDLGNHKKIVLHLQKNHKLTIEETNEDILFIE